MKQGILSWSRCSNFLSPPPPLSLPSHSFFAKSASPITATLETSKESSLTARERRQLRNEKREQSSTNWREEVENKLLKKHKKEFSHWTENLNLDYLAQLDHQWWIIKIYKISCHDAVDRLNRLISRNYPGLQFKVCSPAVQVKSKLKNGTISVKPKPLFPGCVFIRCVMNREIHDFICNCEGIASFVGSKVGNTKKQINKPRPISIEDIEAVFQKEKEEQEKHDKEFEEARRKDLESGTANSELASKGTTKKQPKKSLKMGSNGKLPRLGSTVRVLSGSFAEFTGILKKVDLKMGMATVGFTLFGKETLADLDIDEIVADTN